MKEKKTYKSNKKFMGGPARLQSFVLYCNKYIKSRWDFMFSQKANKKFVGGFTLFIAITITGLLLLVGLAISNIALKEIILSTTGRESQIAFFASNSGIECALYWDQKKYDQHVFATSTWPITPTTIQCGNNNMSVTKTNITQTSVKNDFEFPVTNNSYVHVRVTKDINASKNTVIESRGYNTAIGDTTNQRKLERAIEVKYNIY
ncbi:MAG: pilus assembly PilX N-terminal domain-containing protein [Parcubacteria group bacterium]|nr:pilus assembly PilX N-terminal domain-containing protein [Parcubacteria group bacterium]